MLRHRDAASPAELHMRADFRAQFVANFEHAIAAIPGTELRHEHACHRKELYVVIDHQPWVLSGSSNFSHNSLWNTIEDAIVYRVGSLNVTRLLPRGDQLALGNVLTRFEQADKIWLFMDYLHDQFVRALPVAFQKHMGRTIKLLYTNRRPSGTSFCTKILDSNRTPADVRWVELSRSGMTLLHTKTAILKQDDAWTLVTGSFNMTPDASHPLRPGNAGDVVNIVTIDSKKTAVAVRDRLKNEVERRETPLRPDAGPDEP